MDEDQLEHDQPGKSQGVKAALCCFLGPDRYWCHLLWPGSSFVHVSIPPLTAILKGEMHIWRQCSLWGSHLCFQSPKGPPEAISIP